MKIETPVKPSSTEVVIPAPNFQEAEFHLVGTTPLVVHKFSTKAREQIIATQSDGSQAKGRKKRVAKDFDAVYKEAFHVSKDGWNGFPAAAFRNAMVAACRATDLKMTLAKMAIFIQAEGFDEDGTPLVKIKGTPRKHTAPARNDNGSIDIRVRPMWEQWEIYLRIRFDADMLSLASVANLLARAGMQIGIGEGRPFSKESTGCGWGTFKIAGGDNK